MPQHSKPHRVRNGPWLEPCMQAAFNHLVASCSHLVAVEVDPQSAHIAWCAVGESNYAGLFAVHRAQPHRLGPCQRIGLVGKVPDGLRRRGGVHVHGSGD
jgi:hypothetical protein